jgi:hypothetical protein
MTRQLYLGEVYRNQRQDLKLSALATDGIPNCGTTTLPSKSHGSTGVYESILIDTTLPQHYIEDPAHTAKEQTPIEADFKRRKRRLTVFVARQGQA